MIVVHHPDYVVLAAAGPQFPMDKDGLLIAALDAADVPFERHIPEPAPRAWIEAVHAPAYVAAAFDGTLTREQNAADRLSGNDGDGRRSQPCHRRHVAGGRAGAGRRVRRQYRRRQPPALVDGGAGYCIFNDLAVAAARLLEEATGRLGSPWSISTSIRAMAPPPSSPATARR